MGDIRLEKIQYAYEDYGQKRPVLDDINIHICDGEFVCILGSSGCGKTTLLKLIAGLQLPRQGRVYIDGKAVAAPGIDRAVVFQNYTLFPWMTAKKNVRFGIQQAHRECGKKEADALALKYLKMVGMAGDADKYPCQLSGGMRQRIAIARALAMDSDILLLDEPFGALDARNRHELQELLLGLWETGKKRKTVVFVTHDIAEAVLLADRILYMTPGRVAANIAVSQGRPRDLQDEELKKLQNILWKMFYKNEGSESDYETGM